MSSLCKTCKFKNTKKAEGVLCGDSEASACYSYSSKGPPTLEDLIQLSIQSPEYCGGDCPFFGYQGRCLGANGVPTLW